MTVAQPSRSELGVREPKSATSDRTTQHRTSLAVWEVPAVAERGTLFSIKIGAKCERSCVLSGCVVRVVDSDGIMVSEGVLGDLPAPGTTALYWSHIDCRAPSEVGFHEWKALLPERKGEVVHAGSSFKFGLGVDVRAAHRFAVSVLDAATTAPLANAYVRMGASTLYTDDRGNAAGMLPSGAAEIVVWKRDHKMFRTTVQVPSDEAIEVELTPQPCKYCPDST